MKDWLNSRDLKSALRFYLCGLLIIPPIAIFVSQASGSEAASRVTGLLAIIASCLFLSVEYLNHSAAGAAFLRRLIDIVVSALLLILWAPLLLVIGIAIKLDSPGPILSRRLVVGKNGRVFAQIKFRTMQTETLLEQERDLHFVWKLANDPRVTRVGVFLRRISLDELPQLVNVLRGDMALVGPPPRVAALVARHVVSVPATTPGLTTDSFSQLV